MQRPVDWRLNPVHFVAVRGHLPAALPGLHPDAGQFGDNFAVAVGPDAAARPIAQIFGTGHGTGHAGAV